MENFFKKHGFLFCTVASLLTGAIIFLSLFGYKVLNPFSIDWIFNRAFSVDFTQAYLGWHYYLHSPWRFPLGTYNALSYPAYTSVLNTDSIPLFAIFFKLFKFIIKGDFQYWGIYTLLCFMLQSFTGMLLVRKFTKNDLLGNLTAVSSGLIFCLMPVITIMAFAMPSVVCHFIILACFIPIVYNDKFNLKSNIIFYGALGALAASITPYALLISSVIVLIYSVYLCTVRKDIKQILSVVSFILFSLIALIIIGGFTGIAKYATDSDYLQAAAFNLNGFFNTEGKMFFFKGLKSVADLQTQGYAYFGLGNIFLILISFGYLLYRYVMNKFEISDYKNEIKFVLILIGISLLLAVSPRITYSNIIIGYLPCPDFLVNLWSTFKMTGRYVWIIDYTVLILAICYLAKNINRKAFFIVLMYCLVIQFIDFTPLYKDKSYFKEKAVEYENIYEKKGAWDKMFLDNPDIKHIYFDKDLYKESGIDELNSLYKDMNYWARNKNIVFNNFYFMKPVKNVDKNYLEALKNPKDNDLFLVPKFGDRELIRSSNIKHFYFFHEYIIGRSIPIQGWDDREVSKSDI